MRTMRIGNRTHPMKRGFTLVELLVVIAIIGILVGLLLPAVQAAREAARRCSCSNNISQLALAIHNHEFHYERLPSGVINPTGPIRNEPVGQHVSWIISFLPYMEQTSIYRNFDIKAGTYAESNLPVRKQHLATLQCPSSGDVSNTKDFAATSYVGCHNGKEAPIDAENDGILFLNSRLRFSDITDGTTQTILLGEVLNQGSELGWASGTSSSLRNTEAFELPPNRSVSAIVSPKVALGSLSVGGFGSYHTGGASFAFADGSVQFLSSNIDKELYGNLGNRHDGQMLFGDKNGW